MNVWKLFQEMEILQKTLTQAGGDHRFAGYPKFSFLPGSSTGSYPLINIADDKENVYLEALTPGVDPESLNVTMTRNVLTIAGEKPTLKVEANHFHRNERIAGKFARCIELPIEVNSEKVEADYKNGVLVVTLAKSEVSKPKHISVTLS
jgi:HSP20 family protein